jgi:CRISPR type III-B/RAMP module-associated protein Cmr5
MQTPFIRRAAHARRRVMEVGNDKKVAAKYLTAVRGLPAEIRLIGLGQALATLLSRGKSEDGAGPSQLYVHIERWMLEDSPNPVYVGAYEKPKLVSAIVGTGKDDIAVLQRNYRLAVAELDAYLAVLKRFAEIFLSEESDKAPHRESA